MTWAGRTRLRGAVTLTHQCWLFAVGSTCFAAATVPGSWVATGTANALCFVGSWFFTSAAWVQLVRSGPEGTAGWYSAATQFAGTVLFNVSTAAAVWEHAVTAERRLVWTPDAAGSLAFLLSGAIAVVAAARWQPNSVDWWANWVNMLGCVAFGASAMAAFIRLSGAVMDPTVAGTGTFVGALCFLAAALLVLPRRVRTARRRP